MRIKGLAESFEMIQPTALPNRNDIYGWDIYDITVICWCYRCLC